MAISSQGIGSGLDVNSIVTQLVAIEKQPLKVLQTKASTLQAQLSLYGTIQSQTSALQDAASVLAKDSSWAAQSVSSSDASAVTVSADSTAASAGFGLFVTQLAKSQMTVSRSVSIDTQLGTALGATIDPLNVQTGTLTIQLGDWGALGAGPFAPGSASAVIVDVKETSTYTDIANAINAKLSGVNATVLKIGTTERLSFQTSATASDTGFKITSSGAFAALDSLSFTSGTGSGADSATGMQSKQVGANAKFEINGVAIESATNTVAGAVAGVTLNLLKENAVSSSPIQISVAQDKAVIQKNIQAFADAYTALNTTLVNSTKYVPGGVAGILQGDSATLGLQSLMQRIIGFRSNTGAGDPPSSVRSSLGNLSNAGLELQKDGSLVVNATKLQSTMGQMSNLKSLFTYVQNPTTLAYGKFDGYAVQFREMAKGLLKIDGTGNVDNKKKALQGAISRNSVEQDRVNVRAAAVEKQLRTQYSALDAQMAKMTNLSSYVTAQLAQWNKTT
jgi:flagellar hook-associated protein 2